VRVLDYLGSAQSRERVGNGATVEQDAVVVSLEDDTLDVFDDCPLDEPLNRRCTLVTDVPGRRWLDEDVIEIELLDGRERAPAIGGVLLHEVEAARARR